MAQLAEQAVAKCAGTQLVLSGYSRGTTVTHDAAKQLQSNVTSAIKAVVVFGDPEVSLIPSVGFLQCGCTGKRVSKADVCVCS